MMPKNLMVCFSKSHFAGFNDNCVFIELPIPSYNDMMFLNSFCENQDVIKIDDDFITIDQFAKDIVHECLKHSQ